jgi:hypothetical protein
MEAQEQAKQLDSVTDRDFIEKEVDATKAHEAMSALSSGKQGESLQQKQIVVSKQDVDLIVSELEVTEEVATRVLREVAQEQGSTDNVVVAALRKLVTS